MSNIENENTTVKKRNPNIFSRLGNRISRFFQKHNNDKECRHRTPHNRALVQGLRESSHSHDNLTKDFKSKKGKNIGLSLNVPANNDRCRSEGDLTMDDTLENGSKYYLSNDSLTKSTISGADTNKPAVDFVNGTNNKSHFKSELTNRLRKINPSGNTNVNTGSISVNTTISGSTTATGDYTASSPTRTPQSLSTLSHSSNSLLSSPMATVTPTVHISSETDSAEDIVIDMSTPINKTINASILDSSAARNKISASKQRRSRRIGSSNIANDNSVVTGNNSASINVSSSMPNKSSSPLPETSLDGIKEEDVSVTETLPVVERFPSTKSDKRKNTTSDSSIEDTTPVSSDLKWSGKADTKKEDVKSDMGSESDQSKQKLPTKTTTTSGNVNTRYQQRNEVKDNLKKSPMENADSTKSVKENVTYKKSFSTVEQSSENPIFDVKLRRVKSRETDNCGNHNDSNNTPGSKKMDVTNRGSKDLNDKIAKENSDEKVDQKLSPNSLPLPTNDKRASRVMDLVNVIESNK